MSNLCIILSCIKIYSGLLGLRGSFITVPKEEYEIFWAILAIHHAMFVSDTISINKIRRFLLAYNHKTTYFNEY